MKINIILFINIFLFSCFSLGANPNTLKKEKPTETISKKEFKWKDGDLERSIQIEPEYIAEFGTGNSGKSYSRSAKPAQDFKAVKIWNISGSSLSKSLEQGIASGLSGGISPVFSENGKLMALPGGIIVQLKAGVNFANWAKSKGFKSGVAMELPNFYSIDTPAGMQALEIANNLNSDPNVVSASPNWWIEHSTR